MHRHRSRDQRQGRAHHGAEGVAAWQLRDCHDTSGANRIFEIKKGENENRKANIIFETENRGKKKRVKWKNQGKREKTYKI